MLRGRLAALPSTQSSVGSAGSTEQRVRALGRHGGWASFHGLPGSEGAHRLHLHLLPAPRAPGLQGFPSAPQTWARPARQHLLLVPWVRRLAGGAERLVHTNGGTAPASSQSPGLSPALRARPPQSRASRAGSPRAEHGLPGPAVLRPAGLLQPLCPALRRPVRAPPFSPLIGLTGPSSSNTPLFLDLSSWALPPQVCFAYSPHTVPRGMTHHNTLFTQSRTYSSKMWVPTPCLALCPPSELKGTTAWPRRGLRVEAAAGKLWVGREGGGRAGLAQAPGQRPVVVSEVRRVRWATEARAFGPGGQSRPWGFTGASAQL